MTLGKHANHYTTDVINTPMKVWILARDATCQEIGKFLSVVLYNHSHPPIQKLTGENLSPLWDLAQSPTPGLQDASHITMYTLDHWTIIEPWVI